VWEEYREHLAAHPDAIEFPQHFIDNGWTRVAVIGRDSPVGFSVVISGRLVRSVETLDPLDRAADVLEISLDRVLHRRLRGVVGQRTQ